MNSSAAIASDRWEYRIDQWIAVLGGCVPVAVVAGVVAVEFFISFTGLAWLISRMKFSLQRDQIMRNPLFWPVLSWFGVILLSRIINGGTAYQFGHDIAFLRFPLFFTAMLDLSTRMPIHRYLLGGIAAGVVYAALNFLSAHLIGYDFVGKPLSRYLSKLKEMAKIGGLCAYAAPFFLLWTLFDRPLPPKKRFRISIISVVALLLLFFSRIRTAQMAALIAIFGGWLGQMLARKRMKPVVVPAMLLLAAIGAWGIYRISPSLSSIYDRIYIWQVSWQLWLQNPVFGVGISSFKETARQIAASGVVSPFVAPNGIVYADVSPHHAHNLFLQLMACNGVLGLATFGWVLYRAITTVWKNRSAWAVGLLSWPFVCLAIGLTGWNIYDPFYTALVYYFLSLIGISANFDARVRPL